MPDFESMTDLEIKQYKTRLHHLREDASRAQDREIAAEMQRAQAVLNARGRARTAEHQRIAAEAPGAISTTIEGAVASGGAVVHTPGG